MAEKRNWWTQTISAMNGALSFGKLSPKGDVTSSVDLQGLDGRHFVDLTEDGVRKGWTTMNAPGAVQINAGEDLKKEQDAVFMNAENGDVIIRARNGKVRIEGLDVEISATGTSGEGFVIVGANEDVKVDGKNITLNGKNCLKLMSTGVLVLDGKLGMQILSTMCYGASSSSDNRKKPGQIK